MMPPTVFREIAFKRALDRAARLSNALVEHMEGCPTCRYDERHELPASCTYYLEHHPIVDAASLEVVALADDFTEKVRGASS